jgi:hypothetical protein
LRGEAPFSIPYEEDLEEDHWVFDVFNEWVEGQVGAKESPFFPVGVGGCGAACHDAVRGGMLRSAPITEERIAGVGLHSCHDRVCG